MNGRIKTDDLDAWEVNRLEMGGTNRSSRISDVFDDLNEKRTHILVEDFKPPFLDGRVVFSKRQEQVSVFKDANGDMARICKNGSDLMRKKREEREKRRTREKFWELGGSKMGKIMGVVTDKADSDGNHEEEEEEEEEEEYGDDNDKDYDYRKKNQFAEYLKVAPVKQVKSMKEQRESLPIFKARENILSIVRENQVCVLVGETGSGKTTQLTQYLYEAGFASPSSGIIGCTQPRRVAAVSIAKRVADEMGTTLGKEVGYAIRFDSHISNETMIKYMTDGVLLQESIGDSDLDKYSVIIMDEAHERSLNTDVLLGLMKEVLRSRSDLRLVVTSATMNSEKFAEFFGDCAVINIPGRTYPVDTLFSRSPAEDFLAKTIEQTLAVHLGYKPGDILVFLTGQEEIEIACKVMAERLLKIVPTPPKLDILPIYSQLPAELQAKIFLPSENRKCVVATNIAETSLTVDGVRYVVDCGYVKMNVFNPRIGMDTLQMVPISKQAAMQRAGRAGRTAPGTCWRMYTENSFHSDMLDASVPEIQRTNLGHVVLLLKSLNVTDLLSFQFLDPPPEEMMINAMYQLWCLGALSNTGALTDLGRRMVEFPLDPPLAKMVLTAVDLRCSAEIVIIVAMLNVPNIFFRPKAQEEKADEKHAYLHVRESDHLTLLNIYNQWKKSHYSSQFCKEYFLQERALKHAREIHAQLKDIMSSRLHMQLVSCGSDTSPIRRSICSAFFHQAARVKGVGEYSQLRTGMTCALHPTSALAGSGSVPDYVVYNELTYTTKEFMRVATAVTGEWLAEYGHMFYKVKDVDTVYLSRKRMNNEKFAIMEEEIRSADNSPSHEERKINSNNSSSVEIVEVGGGAKPSFLARRNKRRKFGI